MGKTKLPPGFRFHPTDVELIKFYLKRKVMGRKFNFDAVAEVDIYKYAPWDLPARSSLRNGDLKWYFFCPREKKYASGARQNRATEFGYWKTTGKDRAVRYKNETVGMIKTLVFHRGKAPRGDRTDWVMHEYRIEEKDLADRGVAQDAYVLCIVFQKDGPGPRNCAQYGAPFKEEDWDDEEDVDFMDVVSSGDHSVPMPNQIRPIATSISCLSDANPSVENVPAQIHENNGVSVKTLGNEHAADIEAAPRSAGIDIYNNLGDLGNCGKLIEGACDFSLSNSEDNHLNKSFPCDNGAVFVELRDLDYPLNGLADPGEPEFINIDESCFTVDPSLLPKNYTPHDLLAAFLMS
ncbi:hypothetical protein Pint_27271 [Pistacia integerrima]|uniref:Uncharacterized protein n=1 Tax=Pistacia integerrima TaxID=434235 RepID=A0ACC0YQK7_9ROSI|nr:hypothetical protein Pint_27271 [Pistacia integerrima]